MTRQYLIAFLFFLSHDKKRLIYSNSSVWVWMLKVVSATFGTIKTFKQQSLSFTVVSKIFFTQNYLLFIPCNILHFSCLSTLILHIFNPEIIEANTILNIIDCGINIIAAMVLMTYANALTRTRPYWKYILIITPCKKISNKWIKSVFTKYFAKSYFDEIYSPWGFHFSI